MIEILEYKPFKPKEGQVSNLKGFVRLKLKTAAGTLICSEMQVFSKGGRHWVNFPARRVQEGAEYVYYPYCKFESKEEADKFSENAIQALKAWNLAKPTQGTDPTKISQPIESNGPKKAIDKPEVVSMSPPMVSVAIGEALPF